MLRVHFVARQQIIERANPVPRAPRAEELADQELLIPGVEMFTNAHADARLQLLVRVLQAFALAERIVNQHDISLPRQALREGLVNLLALSVGGVSATADDGGHFRLAAL